MDIYKLTRDKNGTITYCSNKTAKLFGQSKKSLLGSKGFKHVQPEYNEQSKQESRIARETGTHISTQIVYIKPHWYVMAMTRTSNDGENVTMTAFDMSPQLDPQGLLKNIDQEKRTMTFPRTGITINEADFIILNRYLRGWTQKRIAAEIGRSRKTVEHWIGQFKRRSQELHPDITMIEAFRRAGALWVMVARDTWFLERRVKDRRR